MTAAPAIAVASTSPPRTSGGELRRRTASIDDRGPEEQQRRSVRLRREDLGAAEAERHPSAGGAPREPCRPDAQAERDGVDEHVRGIREERQRVCDQGDRHLDGHERDDQREGVGERPDLRVGRGPVVVGVVVAHARSVTT